MWKDAQAGAKKHVNHIMKSRLPRFISPVSHVAQQTMQWLDKHLEINTHWNWCRTERVEGQSTENACQLGEEQPRRKKCQDWLSTHKFCRQCQPQLRAFPVVWSISTASCILDPLLASLVSFRNVAGSNVTSCTLWNVSNHGRSVFFISENSCCHFNSLKDNWRRLTKSIMGDRRWTMAAVVPNSMAIFTIIVTKAVLHIFVCLWISLANYESEKGNNEIWTLCWAPLMHYVLTIPQLKLLFSVLVWMIPSYLGLFWHKDWDSNSFNMDKTGKSLWSTELRGKQVNDKLFFPQVEILRLCVVLSNTWGDMPVSTPCLNRLGSLPFPASPFPISPLLFPRIAPHPRWIISILGLCEPMLSREAVCSPCWILKEGCRGNKSN